MNELANPLELCGFEFIEFVSEDGQLDPVFQAIGFTKVAKHKSKNVYLWRQGNINIILNYQPESYAAYFYKEHGPSACAMGFRTKNAAKAFQRRLKSVQNRFIAKSAQWSLTSLRLKESVVLQSSWSIVTFTKMILSSLIMFHRVQPAQA